MEIERELLLIDLLEELNVEELELVESCIQDLKNKHKFYNSLPFPYLNLKQRLEIYETLQELKYVK